MTSKFQCLEWLEKPVLEINAINHKKGAENSNMDNIRLENKLLLLKSFCIMITQNFWIFKGLVNSTIDMVNNMI